MRRLGCLAPILALAAAVGADVPAALDAGRPEGAELTAQTDAARNRYDLPIAAFGGGATPVQPLEGRVVRTAWTLEDAALTPEGAVEDYRARLAGQGFEPVFRCRDRACGGFDFRFGAELMPAPVMLMDTGNFAQLSMAAPDGRFASVLASQVLDTLHIQTVMVEGAPVEAVGPVEPIAPPTPVDAPDAPEAPAEAPSAAPATGADAGPPAAASSMGESLAARGHAMIDGLAFTPGGTDLAASSAEALDRLARLLVDMPDRSFALVGHSDNVGGLEGNIALSRRRAEAVQEALIARGVAPGRIEAHGAGWLAPVATNATEAGRRLNRRVEIVAR